MAMRRLNTWMKNGKGVLTEKSATEVLLEGTRGAYTTARTWKQHSIFRYNQHVRRLASSVKLIVEKNSEHPSDDLNKLKDVVDDKQFEPILRKELERGLRYFFEQIETAPEDEVRITVLVSWEKPEPDHDYDIDTHYTLLPPRRTPPVSALLLGAPRSNAQAKDSQWIRDKQWLEDARGGKQYEEVLLVDEEGGVLEGTQTNFFVVYDNKLWTAGEGVLEGTVRAVVLQAAKELGIEVELQTPKLSTLPQWDGCFITSTSRLVLNVDTLTVHHALCDHLAEDAKQQLQKIVEEEKTFDDIEEAEPSVLSPQTSSKTPLARADCSTQLKGSELIQKLERKVHAHLEDSSIRIMRPSASDE